MESWVETALIKLQIQNNVSLALRCCTKQKVNAMMLSFMSSVFVQHVSFAQLTNSSTSMWVSYVLHMSIPVHVFCCLLHMSCTCLFCSSCYVACCAHYPLHIFVQHVSSALLVVFGAHLQ